MASIWTKNTSEETKTTFEKVQNEIGASNQLDTVEYLLKFYLSRTSNVRDQKKNDALLSAQTKLSKIWLAVQAHNNKELSKPKKLGEKHFILFDNQSFINANTGANRSRDIKPFLKSIESEYKKHLKKLKIDSMYKMNTTVTAKNEKGQSVFFQSVLKDAGLNDLFKTRK